MVAQAKHQSDVVSSNDIVVKVAEKYSVDAESLLQTLKSTAFKQSGNKIITDEQMYALLIVSDQYNLNPFTKEIYAFPDKSGGIVPVVSVDGWNRISNEHPHFDGVEFEYSKDVVKPEGASCHCHAWIEAILYRKDRTHPTRIREYLDECYRLPFKSDNSKFPQAGPWQTHPKRLLRHKAEIQCYRVGFGFVGIYDEDEAYRIFNNEAEQAREATVVDIATYPGKAPVEKLPPPVEEAVFNQAEMDGFIQKLARRAVKTNQWQAASDLLDERYHGKAYVYAKERLSSERLHLEKAVDASPSTTLEQASSPDKQPSVPVDADGAQFF